MRKIKFRARNFKGDKWVYFDLRMILCSVGIPKTFDDLDPKTLEQYTGLKDKKGKKIYEGDIVKTTDWVLLKDTKFEVIFGKEFVDASDYEEYSIGIVGFYLKPNDFRDAESILKFQDIEVIGNIYENQELLN